MVHPGRRRRSTTAFVSCSKPDAGGRDVVGHDEVGALAGELARGRWPATSSVSAAKPTSVWPGRLRGAEAGEDVGRRLEDDVGDAVVLLDLLVGDRRPGGSRRRRRPSRRRRRRRCRASTACSISAAVLDPHDARCRPATGTVDGGDERDLGARGAAASSAMAWPCLPDERLPMNRTGSIGSRVPPAVTSTRRPARSGAVEHALDGGDDRRRLGQPTGADVAAGEAARLGRDDVHAPPAQRARGCPAPPGAPTSRCASPGTRTTGARVASSVVVSRSSEMPAA